MPGALLAVLVRTWATGSLDRPADGILLPILAVLAVAGIVGCFSSPSRAGGWAFRIAQVLGTTGVVAFFGYLVIGGLFAPAFVADPGASRGPSTPTEAVVFALIVLSVLVALGITWAVEGRRRRRR